MTLEEFVRKTEEVRWLWPEGGFRVRMIKDVSGKTASAEFQLCLEDKWHTVGTRRNPFSPNAVYEWDEAKEQDLKSRLKGWRLSCGRYVG